MPIGKFRFKNSSDRPATPRIHYWPVGATAERWTTTGQAGPIVPPGAQDNLGLSGSHVCKLGPIYVDLPDQMGGTQCLAIGCTLDHYDWSNDAERPFDEIYLDVTGQNGAYELSLTVRGLDVGENGEAVLKT